MIVKVVKQLGATKWAGLDHVDRLTARAILFVAVSCQVFLNSLNLETEQTEILLYGAKIWFMR